MSEETRVAIIGAGPAGLTAGYLLSKRGIPVTVLEADSKYVGGISRTVVYKGFRFDIGGHRFFSKSQEVEALWNEILPNDFLDRPRLSRIFYKGKLYSYPLKAFEALSNLGFLQSTLCVLSYAKARALPVKNAKTFEDWVSNQFGKRLFSIFFKTYTEKVWGMSCKEISADWAAQRIKGLSLGSAIINALLPKKKPKDKTQVIKTLIDCFRYPRKGPGMMWEVCAEKMQSMGGKLMMGVRVSGCEYDAGSKTWTVTYKDSQGQAQTLKAEHVISTAAIRDLIPLISTNVAPAAKAAAQSLRYRDFLIVSLIIKDRNQFEDNWLYIHDPSVKVGRIQNFKSWSPELVPDPSLNCYGMEYFCFEGDGLWTSKDEDLIEQAKNELAKIGVAKREDIVEGTVIRYPKAYPVYDDSYAQHVAVIRDELAKKFPTLHLIGRNGMHKYNNQDHAMMTAMLCAENIIAGKPVYDLWRVNQDAEYHEEGLAGAQSSVSGLRLVPNKVTS